MKRLESVPLAAATACAVVVALVTVPYLVADSGAVGVYYDAGPATPLFVGVLAVVAGMGLVSGAKDRADAATVAAVALVFGLFMTGMSAGWAVAVDPATVGGLGEVAALEHHRWLVVATSLVATALAGWYAKLVV
jgi:hypothetical protein